MAIGPFQVLTEFRMLNLDPGTFGGTPACHVLVQILNEHGDSKLARRITKLMSFYTAGLNDLMKARNPTRKFALEAWKNHCTQLAQDEIKPLFDEVGLKFSFVQTILSSKYNKIKLQAHIIDKLSADDGEDLSYHKILSYLGDKIRQNKIDELLDEALKDTIT